ncbi:MAG: prepilin-type N-terminal cleavage/methylation domain-containing protein [Patescibacteria group bacterium]|jgi:prepilin-type N-terminal cleavage/methylation domain-containing protein
MNWIATRVHLPGFSMLEMLLVVATIGILATISIPIYRSILTGNEMQVAREILVRGLRVAELRTQSGAEDASWGVFAQSGSVTIFSGANYVERDPTLDDIYVVSQELNFSGDTEVTFTAPFGQLLTEKTLILSQTGHDSISITINLEGAIAYE